VTTISGAQVPIYNSTAAEWRNKTLFGDINMNLEGLVTVSGIQGVKMSATPPTDGQNITYSSALGIYQPTTPAASGGADDIFDVTSNVVRNSGAASTVATDDFVFGSTGTEDTTNTDHDARMFFDKSKGAFRAGRVTSDQWNAANRGDYSTAFGDANTAAGNGSFVAGQYNAANGVSATCLGHNNTGANGNYSTVIGRDNGATNGAYQVTIGYENSQPSSNYEGSMALGYQAKPEAAWGIAQSSGQIAAAGDAQTEQLVMKVQTTNNTQTEVYGDFNYGRIFVASDTTKLFDILIVARRTDANDESAAYRLTGCIDNNGGTTALVGSVTKTVIAEDTAGWDVDAVADDENDRLAVKVTGENAKTINWVAFCRIVKAKG